jgi:hypothetical protein
MSEPVKALRIALKLIAFHGVDRAHCSPTPDITRVATRIRSPQARFFI